MGDAMAQQEWKVVRRRRSSEGACNMSASPMARAATQGQDIPTRRVVITSEEDMPTDYSSTPGGTIFGTTPGGTKIVYERAFLVNMRNSPLSRTPPTNLPNIPGVTSDLGKKEQKLENHIEVPNKEAEQNGDDQFSMASKFHTLLPFFTSKFSRFKSLLVLSLKFISFQ